MIREKLEECLEKLSNNTDFTFNITEINDTKINLEMYGDNPAGEDWIEYLIIYNPKTEKDLIYDLYLEVLGCYESFDIEGNVFNMLEAKRNGLQGVPNVVDLVKNEEYKEKALRDYVDKLWKISEE